MNIELEQKSKNKNNWLVENSNKFYSLSSLLLIFTSLDSGNILACFETSYYYGWIIIILLFFLIFFYYYLLKKIIIITIDLEDSIDIIIFKLNTISNFMKFILSLSIITSIIFDDIQILMSCFLTLKEFNQNYVINVLFLSGFILFILYLKIDEKKSFELFIGCFIFLIIVTFIVLTINNGFQYIRIYNYNKFNNNPLQYFLLVFSLFGTILTPQSFILQSHFSKFNKDSVICKEKLKNELLENTKFTCVILYLILFIISLFFNSFKENLFKNINHLNSNLILNSKFITLIALNLGVYLSGILSSFANILTLKILLKNNFGYRIKKIYIFIIMRIFSTIFIYLFNYMKLDLDFLITILNAFNIIWTPFILIPVNKIIYHYTEKIKLNLLEKRKFWICIYFVIFINGILLYNESFNFFDLKYKYHKYAFSNLTIISYFIIMYWIVKQN